MDDLSGDSIGVLTSYLDIASVYSLYLGSTRPVQVGLRRSLTHIHTGSSYEAYSAETGVALRAKLRRTAAALLWSVGYRLNGQRYMDCCDGSGADLAKLSSVIVLTYKDDSATTVFIEQLLQALSTGLVLGLEVLVLVVDSHPLSFNITGTALSPARCPEQMAFELLTAAVTNGHLRSLRRIGVNVYDMALTKLATDADGGFTERYDSNHSLLSLLADRCPLLESVDGFSGKFASGAACWPSLSRSDLAWGDGGGTYSFLCDSEAYPSLRRLHVYAQDTYDLVNIFEAMGHHLRHESNGCRSITALAIDLSEMNAQYHYQAQEFWTSRWPRGFALFPSVRSLVVNHWLPGSSAFLQLCPQLRELSVCPGYEDPAFVALMGAWNPATSSVSSLTIARRVLCLQGSELSSIIRFGEEHCGDREYAGELAARVRQYRSEAQVTDCEPDPPTALRHPCPTTVAFARAAADRLHNLQHLSLCEDFVVALASRREPLAGSSLSGLSCLRLEMRRSPCDEEDPRATLLPLLDIAAAGRGTCRCCLVLAPRWVLAVQLWVEERGGGRAGSAAGVVEFDIVLRGVVR